MDRFVISISREFGSGGRLIGKELARQLDVPCYDRTIIRKTAERSGLSPEFIARAEERARSRFHLSFSHVTAGGSMAPLPGVPVGHQAFFAQAEVIRELADQGSCVIVGRCSDYVLADRPECLKVFIHADLTHRVERCVGEYQIPMDDVERQILQTDRGRANYYNYFTGGRWGDMRRYDLTVNSGVAGIQGSAELIAALLRARTGQGLSPR